MLRLEVGVAELREPQADWYRCVGWVEEVVGAVLRYNL